MEEYLYQKINEPEYINLILEFLAINHEFNRNKFTELINLNLKKLII
jgi:hypothetical protein